MKASPGRPLEFDPDTALEAAMQVFWRKGYESTSMLDLLDAMQLSKSSLYQAFGGKQALFSQCLLRYTDTLTQQFRAWLAQSPSAMVFIRSFVESVLDEARGVCEARGCLVLNTVNEFGRSDPEVASSIAEGLARIHGVMLSAVQRAQAEGDIPPQHDAVTLANYLVSSMSGLKTLSKAGADEASLRGIIEMVLASLQRR